jgi:hypothetical protein
LPSSSNWGRNFLRMKDFYLFLKCLSFNTYCSFQKNQDVKRRSSSTKFAVGLVVIYTSMSTAGAKFIVGVIDSRMDSFFHRVLLCINMFSY